MNNKAINELAFVGYDELSRSQRLLSTEAEGLILHILPKLNSLIAN